jgi:hypothetical protein
MFFFHELDMVTKYTIAPFLCGCFSYTRCIYNMFLLPCLPLQTSKLPGCGFRVCGFPISGSGGICGPVAFWFPHLPRAPHKLPLSSISSFLATRGIAPLTRTLGRATWFLGWMKVYSVFASERGEGLWSPRTWAMERKEEVGIPCFLIHGCF